jgi:hypothetical protein
MIRPEIHTRYDFAKKTLDTLLTIVFAKYRKQKLNWNGEEANNIINGATHFKRLKQCRRITDHYGKEFCNALKK